MSDSNPQDHFAYFINQLNPRQLAYLHILEGDMMTKQSTVDYRALRDIYTGVYIANNGYDKARAQASLANGDSDLVAFGIPFLANPDLVYRLQNDLTLNEADQATFYGGDEHGYTDYPFAE
jgi:N-ethylmaleimide reductase